MKLPQLFASVVLIWSAQAQVGQQLPGTLPQLVAVLPDLLHQGKYQRGPFSDAVDQALSNDPSSAFQAASICAKNLEDADPQVRVETLAVLHAIAISPQGPNALKPIENEIAQLLVQEDEWSQRLTLLIVIDLKQNASDTFTGPLEQLVQEANIPDRNRVGAAAALASARPTDTGAQNVIVNAINDTSLSTISRSQILSSTASPSAGVLICENAVRLANTSTDKSIRDAAISAVTKIGPAAVAKVKTRLAAIQNDSAESLGSRRVASDALQTLR